MVQVLVEQLLSCWTPSSGSTRNCSDFSKASDRSLFECLKGAGAVLAKRLLAAFGADRDRFEAAHAG